MNFFKSDLFKVSIVTVIVLGLVFFIANTFVLHAFSLSADLQDRNAAINKRMAQVVIKHKRVKKVVQLHLINAKIQAVEAYINSKVFNIQPATVKLIAASIVREAQKHEVPVSLAVGVIQAKSAFNPTLLTNGQQRGLFQLSVLNIKNVPKKDTRRLLHEVEFNTQIGMEELAKGFDKYGDNIKKVLIATSDAVVTDDFATNVASYVLEYIAFENKRVKAFEKTIDAPELIKLVTLQMKQEAEAAKQK